MRKESDAGGIDQIVSVVRRRWWIIAACFAAATAVAIGYSLSQEKQYTATATLLFRDPGFDQKLFGTAFVAPQTDPAREAATNLDLVDLPTVAVRTARALGGGLTSAQIRRKVDIATVGQADLAAINATDPSPVLAAKIANAYAQQYVLFRQDADRAKITGALQLIQGDLASMGPTQRLSSQGQALQSRAGQLEILAALQTGNAEPVQAASAPSSPSSPKTTRNGLLGALLGLIIGFGMAFLIDRLDRRIKDPSELEETYGVPLLGAVVESPALSSIDISLPPREAEAFALLRARLRYFDVDRDVHSLLVTSPGPGDGKTTVALHLAIAEAQAGTRVVLVEADLRRPNLARKVGLPTTPGLSELLSQIAGLDDALRHLVIPDRFIGTKPITLPVIFGGLVPPNPAELLESRAMRQLLDTLSERFDLVLVDSAPISVVSDAIPLTRLVSGVIIISHTGRTTRDAARHLRGQLANLGAPTLGVVANGLPLSTAGYYGYGYGYMAEPDAVAERSGVDGASGESGPEAATPGVSGKESI